MKGVIQNISIEGIQVVLPTGRINNSDFSNVLGERRCRKQIRLTGVQQCSVSPNEQTTTDLAYEAGKVLLKKVGWNPEEIDVLVFATQDPLFCIPSTAFYLQKRLGISTDCVVFDVNLGCSAAIVGMQIVSSLLKLGGGKGKGVLLVADAIHAPTEEEMAPDALAHHMLFGSAGSAVALQYDPDACEGIPFFTRSDGTRYRAILRRRGQGFEMDGEAVFSFGINDVVNDMIKFRDDFKIMENNVDYYSFHQAQSLMLTTIDEACGICPDKELRSLSQFGNTNGSSVLLNLCANLDKFETKTKLRAILCAFGVGLSWSYMYVTIPTKNIFPIAYSDRHYEE